MGENLYKNIKNVNSGTDPSRIQQDKPAHFVNQHDEEGNHYEFFATVSSCESFKDRLLEMGKNKGYK